LSLDICAKNNTENQSTAASTFEVHFDSSMAIKTWAGVRGRALRVLVSIASSSAFLLFGYDQGVFAGLIGGQGFKGMGAQTCWVDA
jgi:hypothetical protein